MAVAAINNWLQAGQPANSAPVHRQLLIISGSASQCYGRAERLLTQLPEHITSCWAGSAPPPDCHHIDIGLARQLLGQEFDIAVYDAHQPFRPSAFMALAGTVRKGGRLIILTPSFELWAQSPAVLDTHYLSHGYTLDTSHYLMHLQQKLLSPEDHTTIAHWFDDDLHLPVALAEHRLASPLPPFKTHDQAQVFAAIQASVATTNAAIVLTAPRGRGKSSLLGLLAAELLMQGNNVTLTSPVSQNVDAIFATASNACGGKKSDCRSPRVTAPTTGATLQWHAPDSPGLSTASDQYLLIDEAASLPLTVTKTLAEHYNTLIIATTTQGYEGSGQGFITRFLPWLSERKTLSHYTLQSPVRWLDNDPIERFCEDALLFLDEHNTSPELSVPITVQWHITDFNALCDAQLREVIQLLTIAHYQTTPDDIMRLIDAPDSFLIMGEANYRVVCVCIVNREGGHALASIASNISRGERRVKGHLGAQRLALLAAEPELACFTYWRINRIAVLPSLQHNGIGTDCLNEAIKHAMHTRIDMIISSFGATPQLEKFWYQNGFDQVATGIKPDKASGARSALVVYPVDQRSKEPLVWLRRLFDYDCNLRDIKILNTSQHPADIRCRQVLRDRLKQFSQGFRSFDQLGAAWRYFLLYSEQPQFRAECTLGEISGLLKVSGKREASDVMRRQVAEFLQDIREP